jgi:hypothetical protein
MLLDPIKLMPPELVPFAPDIDAFTATTRVRLLWPPIGVGGGGTVVTAQDQRGADLAIKIILADTDAMRDQVQREATILKQVQHAALLGGQGVLWQKHYPHVDVVFLAMELVEGQTLAAYLDANGTLDEATALEWTIAVAEGLAAIHRQKVIHRDVKPENIILAQVGRRYQPVLVDYGIAKVGQHTERGAKAATDGYAPPEQYTGGTDQRSDIYALGATLFEMVTGRTPPKATRRDVKAVLEPRQFNARLSPELEVVIQLATACDPGQRFPTMGALLDALRLVESRDTAALSMMLQAQGLMQHSGQRAQPGSVSRAQGAPQLPPLPLKKAAPKLMPAPLAPPPAPVSSLKGSKQDACPLCREPLRAGELFCPECGFALVPDVSAGVLCPSSSGGAAAASVSLYPDATLEFHLWEVLTARPITLGNQPLSSDGVLLLIVLYVCWFGFGLLSLGCLWWAISGDEGHFDWVFGFMDVWALWFGVRLHRSAVYRQGHTGAFARGVFQGFASLALLVGIVIFAAALLPVVPWHLPLSRPWFAALVAGAVSLASYPCVKLWLS